MRVSPGTVLGAYEVLAPIGAGGMGEVYRARDTKLGRDVAIKVLPESLRGDPEALARFEREARAVAALSHPNILSIHDFGTSDGVAFAVTELLEGDSLRERLASGPLPTRRAVDYAMQIAQGLAAAHEKGIVHRDIKPENVFVTREGRVKVLDFGLARMTVAAAGPGGETSSPTLSRHTEPGAVIGTVGYMSPEQVRGHPADARSDIFSFGAVLYEMLTGRRAFQRDTAAETMTAILKDDLPEPQRSHRTVPPSLDRIVRHCLEKDPRERFQSARDLAFDLAAADLTPSGRMAAANEVEKKWLRRAALGAALLAVLVVGLVLGRRSARGPGQPSYRRLTFSAGTIRNARFAPDGRTIVYGAAWNGTPARLFLGRVEGPDATALSLPKAEVLAVSTTGELAISVDHRWQLSTWMGSGTLARASLLGGAARPVLEGVRDADYAPGTDDLAVVRRVGASERLEFPIGTVLFQTAGYISHVRFSRDGERIAFFDHPHWGDNRGSVAVIDRRGTRTQLSSAWAALQGGAAWSADGHEVWFSGTRGSEPQTLHAVDLQGRERAVLRAPVSVLIHDIGSDGRVLLAYNEQRRPVLVRGADGRDRDLSWLEQGITRDISRDGSLVLVSYEGEFSGSDYKVFARPTDGGPPMHLGGGTAMGFSPDGRWAASITPGPPRRLVLLPVGAGSARTIATSGMIPNSVSWMPDGRALLVIGQPAGPSART